ncbi:phospholipase [Pimelobacter simplex]|uniref:Phospholipase n=1 Tax=Nocardioides simplex TaxID=2045 RepID=A0A7J5E3J3_NOCSI|nr:phospholipase [Pimelobacter simplex]
MVLSTGVHGDHASWFLSSVERGNRHTVLDAGKPGATAWSLGNRATPLVHGATYFTELAACLARTGPGDLVLFTDWQGNGDERLTGAAGSELVAVLGAAIRRGADVRALIWRSHTGLFGYSAEDHLELADQLQELGADVQLDMRVRPAGAHHQKFVVIRHRDDPARDIAFVGGIDLCHGRRDDDRHHGDPQAIDIADEYGATPPWHDAQVALHGPAVADVETVFRERWEDTSPTTRNPVRRLRDARAGHDSSNRPLPAQAPPPPPAGTHAVQLLRTYPRLGIGWAYDFAPAGERSVARGYTKALDQVQSLVYLEDQFLWGDQMSRVLADALERAPDLHVVAVLPMHPDQEGALNRDPQLLGRQRAIRRLRAVAPDRVAFLALESPAGTPVYVHAKVCVLDDDWATIGSDNFCRRSWTCDSELTVAVRDDADLPEGTGYAARLRATLVAEHLDRSPDVEAGPLDGRALFTALTEAADALDAWHAGGRRGPRPPGRLRRLPEPVVPRWRRPLAGLLYRFVHDPDGRPWRVRLRGPFW